jgi:hypothetical protein
MARDWGATETIGDRKSFAASISDLSQEYDLAITTVQKAIGQLTEEASS